MPSSGARSTSGTSKSGMSMNGTGDGVMGPKTMAALKAFQKDQKLTESGKLDDQRAKSWGSPADAPARPG